MLHSANDVPVVAEYTVSGTTYAPEGTISDSNTQIQVLFFSFLFNLYDLIKESKAFFLINILTVNLCLLIYLYFKPLSEIRLVYINTICF